MDGEGETLLSEEEFADLAAREECVLSVTEKGFGVRSSAYDYRITGRGGQGIDNMDLSRRGDAVVAVFPVGNNDQIMLVTDAGMVIRCPIDDIRIARRGSQGVVIFKVGDGERVVSVARLPDDTEENGDAAADMRRRSANQRRSRDRYGGPMTEPRVGIYPGTFDPITNGHSDIIRRAAKLVDRLVIGVARNDGKGPLFATDERVEIVRDEVAHLENGDAERIEVRAFDTLLMHFAQSVGASVIIRGLRAVSDFEYEFQMAGMNARLNPDIETVFLMASDRYQFISSRFVKEIGALGGDVSHFVSPRVATRLLDRFANGRGKPRRRAVAG